MFNNNYKVNNLNHILIVHYRYTLYFTHFEYFVGPLFCLNKKPSYDFHTEPSTHHY